MPDQRSLQRSSEQPVIFLKMGGSLITEKDRPHTPRLDVIQRLAEEIAAAWNPSAGFHLLLGHGSGSFGHVPAQRYGTRQGVRGQEGWRGFIEVWREAAQLNRLVMDALENAGLPAISFPPSAAVIAADGVPVIWDLNALEFALRAGLLPVVFGDVVFDRTRGGTILSTEDLFGYLAGHLQPRLVLLAGIEAGVWRNFPESTDLISQLSPPDLLTLSKNLGGSIAADVTGGMASKVRQSLDLVQRLPGLQVMIFSGEAPGAVAGALSGERRGTLITSG